MKRPVAVQYCATFLKPEMLHIYRQITGLRRWRPVVFTQKHEHADQFPFEPVKVFPKPRTHALRRLWVRQILDAPPQLYSSEVKRLREGMEQVGASLCHVYFGHIGVHLLPLLQASTVPTVVSFHGADAMVDLHKPAYRRATLALLETVHLVLVRSESLAARVEAIGCDRDLIRIHRTGIPLGELPFRQRSAPTDGAWRFVQACRLIEKKGLPSSLAAFATFARTYPGAKFTIAGEGPMLEELKARGAELGIADRVHFTGFLSQEKLREIYDRAHFFLHPSELGPDGNQEGVPNSMLEAMATGLPVIATRHGGIPEAVQEGISGILVEERDAKALATAALELAGSSGRYESMSREAAAAVAERFDRDRQIVALEGFYDEAVTRFREKSRRG